MCTLGINALLCDFFGAKLCWSYHVHYTPFHALQNGMNLLLNSHSFFQCTYLLFWENISSIMVVQLVNICINFKGTVLISRATMSSILGQTFLFLWTIKIVTNSWPPVVNYPKNGFNDPKRGSTSQSGVNYIWQLWWSKRYTSSENPCEDGSLCCDFRNDFTTLSWPQCIVH